MNKNNQQPLVATKELKSLIQNTVFSIHFTISFVHLLNDMMQSVVPAIYPIIREKFHFSFVQIGFINLTSQLTASILQPLVGFYTDKNSRPYSLALGMCFTFTGLVMLSLAGSFYFILASVAMIGMGSSVFHPESSRIAQKASGGKKGLAQSIFQVGGNTGSAIGPLLAAAIIVPHGQRFVSWFGIAAAIAILVLLQVAKWHKKQLVRIGNASKTTVLKASTLPRKKIIFALSILLVLIFSKYFYMASMSSYYTFYLIEKFHVSIQQSQLYLFGFLAAVAAGTLVGGHVGDIIGRKYVIWISILGASPFTLLLPHVNLMWTGILAVVIGFIIASAFSAILVYATDLLPGKVGMIAGLFFGLAFGMGGLGSAVLGWIADQTNIEYVFGLCAFLPLLGMVTWFLPNIEQGKR